MATEPKLTFGKWIKTLSDFIWVFKVYTLDYSYHILLFLCYFLIGPIALRSYFHIFLQVGFVYFDDTAKTPAGSGKYECFSEEIAFATPQNKKQMNETIGKVISSGHSSRYIPALETAYKLLNSTVVTGDRRKRGRININYYYIGP